MIDKQILEDKIKKDESLRQIGEELGVSYTTVRYWLKKYDIKANAQHRSSIRRRTNQWTEDQLREAVISSITMSEVARKLGYQSTTAGNTNTVKKQIKLLGIDTRHFYGQSHTAVRGSPTKKTLEKIMTTGSSYSSSKLRERLIKEGLKERKCEGCGLLTWLKEPITLELDHINGDHFDNSFNNLRILCPNCHSQTKTWKGRNKVSIT